MNDNTPRTERPNIVFLFTDDQRFDTIRALGNAEIETPNMDRLVQAGTTFTRAHIPGGTSGAVCMPSRAMLHTGRTLFHLDREGQDIPAEHVLLGECLQQAGYRTCGIGKWHNGRPAYARGFTDGAEICFSGMWDHWNVPTCDFDPTGRYGRASPWITNPQYSQDEWMIHADHIKLGKHSSELFADAAVDYIGTVPDDDPFFLYVSFMAPHDPRSMPREFRDRYDPAALALPLNYRDEHPFDFGVRDIRDEVLAPYPRTPDLVREHLADYHAMITHLDHEIGRILDAVQRKGINDRTIFVFAGDNGLAVGQHGLFGKQNLYEHSVRVPLVFAGPGIPEGETRDTFAYLLDIYPTLCDLAGAETPDSVEGHSLLPAIGDDAMGCRDKLYLAYTDKIRGLRTDRYKLVEYAAPNCRTTQLFDCEADPWELRNLADEASHQRRVEDMRHEMIRIRDDWDDMDHPLGRAFWKMYDKTE